MGGRGYVGAGGGPRRRRAWRGGAGQEVIKLPILVPGNCLLPLQSERTPSDNWTVCGTQFCILYAATGMVRQGIREILMMDQTTLYAELFKVRHQNTATTDGQREF